MPGSQQLACSMRDGVELLSDCYVPLPDASGHDGPRPAVLLRTPYRRDLFVMEAEPLVEAGYAVVVQSVRGRHGSGGRWRPFLDEEEDGYDAVAWVAAQPWCTGDVGMIGASYSGWTQWAAARSRPPALRTFVSSATAGAWTTEWPWADGVLWPGAITWLHMLRGAGDDDLAGVDLDRPPWPLSAYQERFPQRLPQADEWLCHPRPDDYWSPLTMRAQDLAAIDLPVLHVTGWFDGCQRGTQQLFEGMRRHSPAAEHQQLVVGPWDHTLREMRTTHDGVDFGPAAGVDYHHLRIAWFDRWLRREPAPDEARVRVFMTGDDRWAELDDLPAPIAADRLLWLREDGVLADEPDPLAQRAEGAERPAYRYDPTRPLPTRQADRPAAHPDLDRSRAHSRDDVCVWESAPLEGPVLLAGAPRLGLRLQADVEDTDVFAEVVDVSPTGGRFLVSHGRLRLRYRNGGDAPLVPGAVTDAVIELLTRAHVFRTGHRVAVMLTGSGVPLWAPHPNRFGDLWDVADPVVATVVVHGSSALRLPVLPGPTP